MISRSVFILLSSLALLTGPDKFDCYKHRLDKCQFQMKQLISSPDGNYTLVCGQRICDGKPALQEVAVYAQGENLNNKCGNAYVSSDTKSPLTIAWQNDTLYIYHKSYPTSTTLLKVKTLYGKVHIAYKAEAPDN